MLASPDTPVRFFGRRRIGFAADRESCPTGPGLADDLRLFALTFAGGFLFMAVYLG